MSDDLLRPRRRPRPPRSARKTRRPSPQVGLILGSGLGGYADGLDDARRAIDYGEIPHFPRSHVARPQGPARRSASARGARVRRDAGPRAHVRGPQRRDGGVSRRACSIALGAKVLIITNAAGGLNPTLVAGHADADPRSHRHAARSRAARPQRRPARPAVPRHDARVRARAARRSSRRPPAREGIALEEGVYVAMPGPTLRDAGRGADAADARRRCDRHVDGARGRRRAAHGRARDRHLVHHEPGGRHHRRRSCRTPRSPRPRRACARRSRRCSTRSSAALVARGELA